MDVQNRVGWGGVDGEGGWGVDGALFNKNSIKKIVVLDCFPNIGEGGVGWMGTKTNISDSRLTLFFCHS